MKIRIKGKIAYNGANYHGWAKQPNNITIQGKLEEVFYNLFKQRITVFGSGRTDAGVNAIGQIFHFDMKDMSIKLSSMIKALNKALPYDIKILSLCKTNSKFNARFSAINKTYIYSINIGKVNPIHSTFIYQYNKKLDLKKIRKISKLFIGKRNFLSFSTDQRDGETLFKQINKIIIKCKDNIVRISINGDGFLRSQVRMIVGSMISFSEGKITLDTINDCFKNPLKGKAVYKAPACGLCLFKVNY